jgi:hypothetical protein
MNKGKVSIDFKGTLVTDHESKWESSPTNRFLRDVYNKFIIPSRISNMKDRLSGDVRSLKEDIKSSLTSLENGSIGTYIFYIRKLYDFSMKRVISVLIAILILLPLTAAQITVEKGRNSVPVVISELGNPSEFELTITNIGETDQFEIYSLVGIQFEPRFFSIESGQTKTIKVQTQISENIREHRSGLTTIGYQIKELKHQSIKSAPIQYCPSSICN